MVDARLLMSVIILIVDQDGVGFIESERQSPIPAHSNRPMFTQGSLQRMNAPAGEVHVLRAPGTVQPGKLQTQARRVCREHALPRPRTEEKLQPLVAEAPDHGRVYRIAIQVLQGSIQQEFRRAAYARVPE